MLWILCTFIYFICGFFLYFMQTDLLSTDFRDPKKCRRLVFWPIVGTLALIVVVLRMLHEMFAIFTAMFTGAYVESERYTKNKNYLEFLTRKVIYG